MTVQLAEYLVSGVGVAVKGNVVAGVFMVSMCVMLLLWWWCMSFHVIDEKNVVAVVCEFYCFPLSLSPFVYRLCYHVYVFDCCSALQVVDWVFINDVTTISAHSARTAMHTSVNKRDKFVLLVSGLQVGATAGECVCVCVSVFWCFVFVGLWNSDARMLRCVWYVLLGCCVSNLLTSLLWCVHCHWCQYGFFLHMF